MSVNFDKFIRLFPFDQSRPSKMQRQSIWDKWDTNVNGFLSLAEIESQLLRTLEIQHQQNISQTIKKSSQETKQKLQIQGKFGPNYLQKRQFRCFLQHLYKNIRNLLILQLMNLNQDKSSNSRETQPQFQHIFKKDTNSDKLLLIKNQHQQQKISFIVFSEWFETIHKRTQKTISI